MKITFYMPLKPPGHKNPSGDLIIGRELSDFLGRRHRVELASSLRSRWIYWKPWDLLRAARERQRIHSSLRRVPADLWLTYHSYYKAPDLLGPACCDALHLPYVIFQGIYSTKRRRSLATLPGFLLNRKALKAAQLVCTNKKRDQKNLLRLLPHERVRYIAPGLQPDLFAFDEQARRELRKQWRAEARAVVLATAMLRPGVKSAGIRQVIDSCSELNRSGQNLLLVVIGDGKNRAILEREAREKLGSDCLFLGRIARADLYRYYSGADLFAFPGIEESLGMVYLEAQSTGLPVVAFSDWGAAEAVIDERTGLLTPASQRQLFTSAIQRLLSNRELRLTMGEAAREHIRQHHDLSKNYRVLSQALQHVVDRYRRQDRLSQG